MIRNILIAIAVFAIVAESSALISSRSKRNTETCGVPASSMGLIIQGQIFPRGAFPWIVALMVTKSRPHQFYCSGTLISKTFVISVANCILPKDAASKLLPRDIVAIFGAHDLDNSYEPGRIMLSPKKIFIHEDWDPRTTSYDADISLLEFQNGKIHFGEYIQPICLWDSKTDPTETTGVVTGWGRSEDTTKLHENLPKLIPVAILTYEQCFLDDRGLIEISSRRTFCAGLRNGSGVCTGDSGGGLFIKVNGIYHLKGIVSSSMSKAGDCDVSRNAVYTNVPQFIDWVKGKTGPLLLATTTARPRLTCGAPKGTTSLIIIGQSFPRGRFPWLVALMYTEVSPSSFFCGATIITSSFVLTAAHCINEKFSRKVLQPKHITAIFGAHDLSSDDEIGRYELKPKRIIIHEDWNSNSSQHDADLALLRFKRGSITFNLFVQPVCLWNSENIPTETSGIVAGWGESEDKTKIHENLPRQITAPIHSHGKCLAGKPKIAELSSDRTFCAGLRNGTGVCRGDSGGGLFIVVNGAYYLRGIVAASLETTLGDCNTFENAVYLDVLEFKDWIEDEIA